MSARNISSQDERAERKPTAAIRSERFMQNVRYGLRNLRRSPTFTTVAVVTFGLGIGANTTIFSVVNAVLLRPLPFSNPGQLVMLEEKKPPRLNHFEASPLNFISWKEQNQSFQGLAAYAKVGFNLSEDNRPERILGARVSSNLFTLLGVTPIRGRSFTAEDDQLGRDRVVILGFDLWRRRYSGDEGILGRQIQANGLSYTVVGIAPPRFRFPDAEELWKPMGFTPGELASRSNHFVWVVARMKPGVTVNQAQMEMDVLSSRLMRTYPDSNRNWGANVFALRDHYVGGLRTVLLVLFAAVGFVLLLACANVANLLLARASSRQREIAVRASLGAAPRQIVAQLLTESALLALLGGALGVLLARWGLRAVLQFAPALAKFDGVEIDGWALAFTLGVSLMTGILFGLAPAVRLARPDLQESLSSDSKGGSPSMSRGTGAALVISEVALALVLLIGAGLLAKSFRQLRAVNPGFRGENVVTAQLSLPARRYADTLQVNQFVATLAERTRALPGVRNAAVSTSLPFSRVSDEGVHFDRPPGALVTGTIVNSYAVTPEYFRTLGIPLIRGRLLDAHDVAGSPPVVVINESMARRFFSDQDPIGTRLDISGPTYMREIVGVVGDVKQDGLNSEAHPQVYESFAQKPGRSFFLLARADVNAAAMAEPIRREVTAIDKDQPISGVATMDELVSRTLAPQTLSALLFTCFAALGLVLAMIGVYGVLAYSVAHRSREIGLRMALGQSPGSILRMVLTQSLVLVAIGISVGLFASFLLVRFIKTLLYGVGANDPVIFALFSGLLMLAALIAALIPAQRASRVDPIVALRANE